MDSESLLLKSEEYIAHLRNEERSENTIRKYNRDLRFFRQFIGARKADKELLIQWKEMLVQNYAPSSVNSMLAAVNGFFDWAGLPHYKVKPLKIQKSIFLSPEKELTREEYERLIWTAQSGGDGRLALVLQTICSTGIRISELKYITVAAAQTGRVVVDCKGKNRMVFLTKNLCLSLQHYCKEREILEGAIFHTVSGRPLDRSNIWREMKQLCQLAGVDSTKVFPHNLRHLFARTYYTMEKDLSRLADLLGHSNVMTTRIYTMESGEEHFRQLEKMDLMVIK